MILSHPPAYSPILSWPVPVETKTRRWNREELSYRGTYVYLMQDADGRVLYVGVTGNPVERWRRHAQRKPWWSQVARIEFETLLRNSDALALERELIRALAPLHNVRSAVARG